MQEFIELKQDSEYLLAFITSFSLFAWIGYQFGEFEKSGGKPSDIINNANHHRALALLRKIIR